MAQLELLTRLGKLSDVRLDNEERYFNKFLYHTLLQTGRAGLFLYHLYGIARDIYTNFF